MASTRKAVNPDLFHEISDYPAQLYACHDVFVGDAQYREIRLDENRDRVVLLGTECERADRATQASDCVFSTISKKILISTYHLPNVWITLNICCGLKNPWASMPPTISWAGIFDRKRAIVLASNPEHSIGFHSFNHKIDDLAQLSNAGTSTCMSEVTDRRVRG